MLFKGYCRIEMIIVSLSLSNLYSPNSNSFLMNLNIAETATVYIKLHFCTLAKTDTRIHAKSMFSIYREICQLCLYETPKAQSKLSGKKNKGKQ